MEKSVISILRFISGKKAISGKEVKTNRKIEIHEYV